MPASFCFEGELAGDEPGDEAPPPAPEPFIDEFEGRLPAQAGERGAKGPGRSDCAIVGFIVGLPAAGCFRIMPPTVGEAAAIKAAPLPPRVSSSSELRASAMELRGSLLDFFGFGVLLPYDGALWPQEEP